MPSNYKIFLSSTKKDLDKERRTLIELLQTAEFEVCCMEWFGAFTKHPKEQVEDYVKECPIYICLIGESYGSIPEIDDILLGKSFTEFEYDAACSTKGMIILCFIKKIERTDPRLIQFVDRVGKHGIAFFKNADDLPGIVLASLRRELNRPENKERFEYNKGNEQKKAVDTTRLSSDLKYFCNRYQQADAFDQSFYTLNYPNAIHLFLLPGQKDDSHTSFVNRYACQFKYEGKDVVEVSVVTKCNPLQNDVQLLTRIKTEIRTQLTEELTLPLREITPTGIFEALSKAKKDFLIINLIVESSYLNENNVSIYKKAFENFFTEISSIKVPDQERKILIFLLFRYSEADDKTKLGMQITEDDSFLQNNKLPRLEKLCINDIEDWLISRKIEENTESISLTLQKYFPEYFEHPELNFSMSKAEIVLDRIIFEKSKKM